MTHKQCKRMCTFFLKSRMCTTKNYTWQSVWNSLRTLRPWRKHSIAVGNVLGPKVLLASQFKCYHLNNLHAWCPIPGRRYLSRSNGILQMMIDSVAWTLVLPCEIAMDLPTDERATKHIREPMQACGRDWDTDSPGRRLKQPKSLNKWSRQEYNAKI